MTLVQRLKEINRLQRLIKLKGDKHANTAAYRYRLTMLVIEQMKHEIKMDNKRVI